VSGTFLMLHGFAGSPASWDPLVHALPASARVLRPALLGHGAESTPDATFEGEVDRIAAAVRREQADGAHLVGYSLGGRIALAMILRHPTLFSRATLISASAGLAAPVAREARRADDEARARVLERDGLEAFLAGWEAEPIFATQGSLPDAVRARRRAERRAHDPRGLAASLRTCGLAAMPCLEERLGEIAIPISWVVGSEDPKFRAIAERITARIPRASLHVVRSAGHDVVLERPAEVAALLLPSAT
jgi:2-succinyl-6-hydroxy-2,4-cyclohexadiene-1-carboxylate synthase